MIRNPELWEKIKNFHLDEGGDFCFSVRLRYENGWTKNFTDKAILEYKKFIYLAAISEDMVSPSETVDKVWHLHLIFTTNYKKLGDLVGKKIEHIPSTHDPKNEFQFKNAIKYTQQIYRENFGNSPEIIWGNISYESMPEFKPSKITRLMALLILLTVCVMCFIPFKNTIKPILVKIENPTFLIFYISSIFVTLIFLGYINRQFWLNKIKKIVQYPVLNELSPDELTYMKKERVSDIVQYKIDKLVRQGKIELSRLKSLTIAKNAEPENLEESIIFQTIQNSESKSFPAIVKILSTKEIFSNNRISANSIINKLNCNINAVALLSWTTLITCILFMIGLARMFTGLENEKPVVFLFIFLVFYAFVMVVFLSQTGEILIRKCFVRHFNKTKTLEKVSMDNNDWSYFLLGTLAMSPLLIPYADQYNERISSSGDSSSSSCGTSSCGSSDGGGGGCGGCGGGD